MCFRCYAALSPARSNLCPCEGRPLEVPNPAATQIPPHRDVWWPTARPFGHPWAMGSSVRITRATYDALLGFWVPSPTVYVHPRTRILQAQQASSNRSDLNEPKAVYVLAHHAYRRCPWNANPHLRWVLGPRLLLSVCTPGRGFFKRSKHLRTDQI